jgi:hypothetical protein
MNTNGGDPNVGLTKGLVSVNTTLSCMHFYKCLPDFSGALVAVDERMAHYLAHHNVSEASQTHQVLPKNDATLLLPAFSVAYFEHFVQMWGARKLGDCRANGTPS